MVINEEQILVRIINKVEGADELVKESNLLSTIKKDNGDLTKVYEEQTATQRKRVTVTEKSNAAGEKQVNVQKETLAQGPRFKMHFLGIMFGGMALNRAMSNLTATSKEWVGIGELMSTTMGVVMLPATLALLDNAVLPLMDALLSLPPEIQTVIGVTVLGLEGLGKIAEVGGQIALGAAAFKIAFPALATKIVSGLTSNLSKMIGKGIVVAVGLTIAWQSIKFQREAIEEGDIMKEIISVIGIGTGLGLIGLTFAGPIGGLIGFTLGIAIGLVIHWFIKENKKEDIARAVGEATEGMQGSFFSETVIGRGVSGVAGGAGALKGFLTTPGQGAAISRFIEQPFGGIFGGGGNVSNQAGNVSIVNNVNVSDKKEFERMLKTNNETIIREVRRNAT